MKSSICGRAARPRRSGIGAHRSQEWRPRFGRRRSRLVWTIRVIGGVVSRPAVASVTRTACGQISGGEQQRRDRDQAGADHHLLEATGADRNGESDDHHPIAGRDRETIGRVPDRLYFTEWPAATQRGLVAPRSAPGRARPCPGAVQQAGVLLAIRPLAMRPRATSPPATDARKMLARPVDSETVCERAPWRVKCSVVTNATVVALSSHVRCFVERQS
jgi:hypothetical protein